jgi:CIC family chloride channel protein
MTEPQRFLLLSILIGLFSALFIVCFRHAIEYMRYLTLGSPVGASPWRTVLAPILGCTVSSLLIMHVFRQARGSGVIQTKTAIYVSDGFVSFTTVLGKFLACSISLGSGAALGPEDPSLQMGSGIASKLGRVFHLQRSSLRMIAPVGAAAGIAAAFNTPITAVLFVVEEVIGAWNAGVLGSTILAAVSAVVASRYFLGDQPIFRIPQFRLEHPGELLVYAVIGVAVGLLSAVFIKAIRYLMVSNERQPRWMAYMRPAGAGLVLGFVGLVMPQVLGPSYGAVDEALHNHYAWYMLLAFGLTKCAMTILCFSAGVPGGMFAPTLFIGATIGGGLGALASIYSPIPTSPVGSYVLVGIGTFFAGVFRAPMTSIFMAFEVSGNAMIIIPVMVANMVSYFLSRALQPAGFFDMISKLEGMELPSSEGMREAARLRVEDAMRREPAFALNPQMTVAAALDEMVKRESPRRLLARSSGWSWIQREELEKAIAEGLREDSLGKAFNSARVEHVYPDLPLEAALKVFGAHDLLPVASRANPRQLLGTLALEDVFRVYGVRSSVSPHA